MLCGAAKVPRGFDTFFGLAQVNQQALAQERGEDDDVLDEAVAVAGLG